MTSLVIVKDYDTLAEKMAYVKLLKDEAEWAKKRFEDAQADLIGIMDSREIFELNSMFWHATKVAGQMMTVDDAGLVSWLFSTHSPLLGQITKTVIDRAKLGQAVSDDEIPMDVVNTYTTTKPKKPYLLITERKNDPDAH